MRTLSTSGALVALEFTIGFAAAVIDFDDMEIFVEWPMPLTVGFDSMMVAVATKPLSMIAD